MNKVKKWLKSTAGRIALVLLSLVCVLIVVFTVRNRVIEKRLARALKVVREKIVESGDRTVDSANESLGNTVENIENTHEHLDEIEERHEEEESRIRENTSVREEELRQNDPDDLTQELKKAFGLI